MVECPLALTRSLSTCSRFSPATVASCTITSQPSSNGLISLALHVSPKIATLLVPSEEAVKKAESAGSMRVPSGKTTSLFEYKRFSTSERVMPISTHSAPFSLNTVATLSLSSFRFGAGDVYT